MKVKTLFCVRHPDDLAVDAQIITLDELEDMNERDTDPLEFLGLYADESGQRYFLLMGQHSHRWVAVKIP